MMETITKKFLRGDKVQLKTGGAIMEVLGYVERDILYPKGLCFQFVECIHFNILEGQWKTDRYSENHLIKIDTALPVWIQNFKEIFRNAQVSLAIN